MNKKIIFFIVLGITITILSALSIFFICRTFTYVPQNPAVKTANLIVKEDEFPDAIAHFIGILQHKTVTSREYLETDFNQHQEFIDYIVETYPNIFENIEFVTINNFGLLFRWKGSNGAYGKKPIIIIGHYDTVDVENSSLSSWIYPPFSATVADGKIYSRGTLDDKASFTAILEAVNSLLKDGFIPERDVYFAFGHDEEIGGKNGAKLIAEYLESQNVFFDLVLDEGGRVEINEDGTQNAYIGISEKGRYSANIKIKSQGIHASRPTKETSVTRLATVIRALNEHQLEPKITPQTEEYYKASYYNYDFFTRFLIANSDIKLIRNLLFKKLSETPENNSYIRSTTASTMLLGSNSSNVIPEIAQVTVDCRILPSETSKDIEKHLKKVIEKAIPKINYQIEPLYSDEPSKVSSTDTLLYSILSQEILEIYPSAKIIPYLMPAASDSKYYEDIADNVYRFLPLSLTREEYLLMHGTNEYISIDNFLRMILFYKNFIKSASDS